jgi:hypothetical protein
VTPADPVDQHARQQRPNARADKEINIHHIAQHRAAENCVRKPMADVAHPTEDDVDADEAAQRAYDEGGDEAVAKKLVFKRD